MSRYMKNKAKAKRSGKHTPNPLKKKRADKIKKQQRDEASEN